MSALIIHLSPLLWRSLKFALMNKGNIWEGLASVSSCFAIPNKSAAVHFVEIVKISFSNNLPSYFEKVIECFDVSVDVLQHIGVLMLN